MHLTGILLAAGASQRFGGDKRLTRLPGGEPLLLHCARTLCEAMDDVLVVLRENDERIAETLAATACRITHNPRAAEGMGSSIGHGVAAAADSDGWLIMPADLPLLRAETIGRIVRQLQLSPAVVPVHNGQRGHPVGFVALYREDLVALRGTTGARHVLARNPDAVSWLEVDDPGICHDIDRPEELALVEKALC